MSVAALVVQLEDGRSAAGRPAHMIWAFNKMLAIATACTGIIEFQPALAAALSHDSDARLFPHPLFAHPHAPRLPQSRRLW